MADEPDKVSLFSAAPMEAETKARLGRPEFQPTEADRIYVRKMVFAGIPAIRIARIVGVDAKTLEKHFAHELECATDEAIVKIAEHMGEIALNGSDAAAVSAGKYMLNTRGKWVETTRAENSDAKADIMTLAEKLLQAQREMEASTVVHPEQADAALDADAIPPGAAGVSDEPPQVHDPAVRSPKREK